MRAYSDNEDLALLSGINPERVVMYTWLFVAALATICGRALRARQKLQTFHLFPAFAADFCHPPLWVGSAVRWERLLAVCDRFFGNHNHLCLEKGAGLLMPEQLEPSGLVQLLSTDYKFAVSFVILLIVLLFKPTGLFSGKAV